MAEDSREKFESNEKAKKYRFPRFVSDYLKELCAQNGFWDEVFRNSAEDNYKCLNELLDAVTFDESEQRKTNDESVEIESCLKQVSNFLDGFNDQLDSLIQNLQNTIDGLSL